MADHVLFNDSLGLSTRTLGNYNVTGYMYASNAANLTATASGGQTNALMLTKMVNHVSTVATTADSVALPRSVAGMLVWVTNAGANSMQVFGQTPDTINGAATATGVALAAGKTATYMCPVAGKWFAVLSG